MKPIRRILYATDFSTASRRAFDTAVRMAKAVNARLTILSVLTPVVTVPSEYVDPLTIDRLAGQMRDWSARQLEKLEIRATKMGAQTAVVLREGDPADQIVRASRATKSDLIVVGTHGRRGVPKFVLGSVAERVLSSARCPVLTVRGT